jgi:hypothetical protein
VAAEGKKQMVAGKGRVAGDRERGKRRSSSGLAGKEERRRASRNEELALLVEAR